jgi:hypothetical protein
MVLSSALSPTMYACFSSVSPGNCPEHHFTVKTQHILLNAYPFIIHDPIILDNVTNAVEKARSNTLVSHWTGFQFIINVNFNQPATRRSDYRQVQAPVRSIQRAISPEVKRTEGKPGPLSSQYLLWEYVALRLDHCVCHLAIPWHAATQPHNK